MYTDFPGFRNASPLRLQKQSTLLSGTLQKGIVFKTGLAFYVAREVMPCFPVSEDNQDAVQLAQNPITTSNLKHVDVRHHFLRKRVRRRNIKVVQVPSEFQHADILTKALAYDLFAFHRKFLMSLK